MSTIVEVQQARELPWQEWQEPVSVEAEVGDLTFAPISRELHGVDYTGDRVGIWRGEEFLGIPTSDALFDLSRVVGYPADFVEKLPVNVRCDVLNSRIIASEKHSRFNLVREDWMVNRDGNLVPHEGINIVTNFAPGWREIVPHAEVCNTAWNVLSSVYSEDSLDLRYVRRENAGMSMRVVTPQDAEVSKNGRALGDVLRFGLDIRHRYGVELLVRLFAERLVCLNGMTAAKTEYEWKARSMGTVDMQLQFIMVGIANALGAFDPLVDRARRMSEIPIEGDPERTLIERARAMRLPQRFHTQLVEAWREEPMPTEWGMLNAFTRFSTHSDAPQTVRSAVSQAAGQWTEEFDVVTARLPRPLAEHIGAHIIDVEAIEA